MGSTEPGCQCMTFSNMGLVLLLPSTAIMNVLACVKVLKMTMNDANAINEYLLLHIVQY